MTNRIFVDKVTGDEYELAADYRYGHMLTIKPLPKPESNVSDVSWSEFIRQVEYKQRWRGGQFVKVDRFFPSSRTCSNCLFVNQDMPLKIREWDCPRCNTHHDRDINAAQNILKQAEVQLGVESTDGISRKTKRVAGSMKRGYAYA